MTDYTRTNSKDRFADPAANTQQAFTDATSHLPSITHLRAPTTRETIANFQAHLKSVAHALQKQRTPNNENAQREEELLELPVSQNLPLGQEQIVQTSTPLTFKNYATTLVFILAKTTNTNAIERSTLIRDLNEAKQTINAQETTSPADAILRDSIQIISTALQKQHDDMPAKINQQKQAANDTNIDPETPPLLPQQCALRIPRSLDITQILPKREHANIQADLTQISNHIDKALHSAKRLQSKQGHDNEYFVTGRMKPFGIDINRELKMIDFAADLLFSYIHTYPPTTRAPQRLHNASPRKHKHMPAL